MGCRTEPDGRVPTAPWGCAHQIHPPARAPSAPVTVASICQREILGTLISTYHAC